MTSNKYTGLIIEGGLGTSYINSSRLRVFLCEVSNQLPSVLITSLITVTLIRYLDFSEHNWSLMAHKIVDFTELEVSAI